MRSGGDPGRPYALNGVLRLPEFRALAVAGLLSATGDQLARVALSVLVYDRTSSPLKTALTYALTFLPAAVGGPLLSGLADRLPRRQLMVAADLVRAALVACMAIRGLPLPALLGLLVVVNLFESPFDSARAALVPDVTGELYLGALVVDRTLQQTAQVLGFAGSGLLLLAVSPSNALLVDAASFVGSAALLRRWVLERPAADDGGGHDVRPGRLSRARRAAVDARIGMSTIWSNRRVRRVVLLTWIVAAFAVVPEGLAAPYARQLDGDRPVLVGLLLAANPVGNILSALPAARWSRGRPDRLLGPLAQLVVLPLALCALDPPAAVVLTLVVLSGAGMTVSLLAQTVFVAEVPEQVRGRAFGIAGTGIIVGQGIAVAAAGAVALAFRPSTVVGGSGVLGAALVLLLLAATRAPTPPRPPAGVR